MTKVSRDLTRKYSVVLPSGCVIECDQVQQYPSIPKMSR
jgi:hypothetical protein